MALFPHFEKTAKNSTVSHFLLMFGYKLFSLYFPLFLLSKGLSLPKIGFVYLLIYLPLAVFSPLVGILTNKINSIVLIVIGIMGYALYSLGMLIPSSSIIFYLLQAILGISASLFFVSNRILLINAKLKKPSSSFGWFYSAPYYAQEAAPVIGALIIWRLGFSWVFIASFVVHIVNIIFTFLTFPKAKGKLYGASTLKESFNNFILVIKKLFARQFFSIVIISFIILVVGGFYQAFFVTFLKHIGWTQNTILFYTSIFSLLFLPLSLLAIRILSWEKIELFLLGSILFGITSILFGVLGGAIGFIGILILMELGELGSFITNSGRSGFLSKIFSSYAKEIGSLDTIFSPLGIAIGSLIGGLLVGSIGYSAIFILGGFLVLLVMLLSICLTRHKIAI